MCWSHAGGGRGVGGYIRTVKQCGTIMIGNQWGLTQNCDAGLMLVCVGGGDGRGKREGVKEGKWKKGKEGVLNSPAVRGYDRILGATQH